MNFHPFQVIYFKNQYSFFFFCVIKSSKMFVLCFLNKNFQKNSPLVQFLSSFACTYFGTLFQNFWHFFLCLSLGFSILWYQYCIVVIFIFSSIIEKILITLLLEILQFYWIFMPWLQFYSFWLKNPKYESGLKMTSVLKFLFFQQKNQLKSASIWKSLWKKYVLAPFQIYGKRERSLEFHMEALQLKKIWKIEIIFYCSIQWHR